MLSRSIARDKYSGTQLTRFFALLMTVNGIAPVISPVLGGYIAQTFHWRALFWTMALAGGVLFLLSLTLIKETRQPQSTPETLLNTTRAVIKNRAFMGFCFVQTFMLAGLFSYIGASSYVLQNEYGMSPMHFSLLFGINGVGLFFTVAFNSGVCTLSGSAAKPCGK